MSKQKRIKKIVKSRLHRIKVDGNPEFPTTKNKIDALASLNALADGTGVGGDFDTPGDGLLLAQLGISNPGVLNETPGTTAELLDIDRDETPDVLDVFPRDTRETADADEDGIGNNKEIHDAALLISTAHTEAVTLFTGIQTKAGEGAGSVDALLDILEALNVPAAQNEAGFADYSTAWTNANEKLVQLTSEILQFKQKAQTISDLFDSIKDFTATADVKYETTPGNAATLKLVTDSAAEAKIHQANMTNNTPELVAAADPEFAQLALMDLATEELKVTQAVTGLTARLAAKANPSALPAE